MKTNYREQRVCANCEHSCEPEPDNGELVCVSDGAQVPTDAGLFEFIRKRKVRDEFVCDEWKEWTGK